jgi:hypothetical protein
VAHLLDGIGSSHPFTRFEVEEQPAFQLATCSNKVGIVGHGENSVIQVAIIVGRMSLTLEPNMNLVVTPFDEWFSLARRISLGIERSQIFISYA